MFSLAQQPGSEGVAQIVEQEIFDFGFPGCLAAMRRQPAAGVWYQVQCPAFSV